jgi:uncharacterized membrane protein YGL010W
MKPTSDEKLAAVITNYRRHHQDFRNKMFHYICVPAIVFSVVGMFVALNLGVGLIAIAAAILYYSQFGPKIALQMGLIFIVMLAVWVAVMPMHHLFATAVGIFVLGWIGQFAGHIYVLEAFKERLARRPGLDPL